VCVCVCVYIYSHLCGLDDLSVCVCVWWCGDDIYLRRFLAGLGNIEIFFVSRERERERIMPFLTPDQKVRLEFVFKYYDTEMKGLLPIRRLGTVRK